MKKTVLFSALILALSASSSFADSAVATSPFYVGGGLSAMTYHDESSDVFGDNSDNGHGGSLNGFGGYQFNRYFALEAGSQLIESNGAAFLNGYGDMKGILPLSNQWDVYGKLGVSILPYGAPLFGLGAEYQVNSHWSVGPEYLRIAATSHDFFGEEKTEISFYSLQVTYTF